MDSETPEVCIEITAVSYLAARPGTDLVVAAHPQLTHEWWETEVPFKPEEKAIGA